VYHQQFESQRLSELASWLPGFAGRIKKIQRRLWDLPPVIRDHVYHPAFGGSFSLKAVLPAMAVANGQAAGLAWDSLVRETLDQVDRQRIEQALRAYCRQDTLALVRILERLRQVSTNLRT
jgi:hypothetical protein